MSDQVSEIFETEILYVRWCGKLKKIIRFKTFETVICLSDFCSVHYLIMLLGLLL